mgnify:FL=1
MCEEGFKKELRFTIVCVILYFAGMIFTNIVVICLIRISGIADAIFEIIFISATIVFLKKRNLLSYYGINNPKNLNFKNLLYFIPMILVASVNLWFGISINGSVPQLIYLAIAMLGVGFSEEILFRSFLMKAVMHKNETAAVIISSVIFGCFHIMNLFGDADLFQTILQIIYATAFGFMCAMFFYRTKNIIPCMICHSLTNLAYVFMPENLSTSIQCIGCIAIIVPSVFYGVYLLRTKKNL